MPDETPTAAKPSIEEFACSETVADTKWQFPRMTDRELQIARYAAQSSCRWTMNRLTALKQISEWLPIVEVPVDTPVLLAAKPEWHLNWKYGVGSMSVNGVLFDWPWAFPPTHFRTISGVVTND